MKSIINGLRYDTETAILIGDAGSNGNVSRSSYEWWEASLYKTPRSGRYFLAGQGGPMTRWARSAGNMTTGSEGIQPLDKEDALEWAENYLTTAEVEAEFGEVVQDA